MPTSVKLSWGNDIIKSSNKTSQSRQLVQKGGLKQEVWYLTWIALPWIVRTNIIADREKCKEVRLGVLTGTCKKLGAYEGAAGSGLTSAGSSD